MHEFEQTMTRYHRTSEAVSPAHPDKVADQVSDGILDALLKIDKDARVAIETMIGHKKINVVGEVTTKHDMTEADLAILTQEVIQRVFENNGYGKEKTGDYDASIVIANQSLDIARGVDTGGAGDQGIMIGYACRGNEAMIPPELWYARQILRRVWDRYGARDMKSQVTLDPSGRPTNVVVSAERLTRRDIESAVDFNQLFSKVDVVRYINPAGDWVGGFDADTGLTGRKIVQDAYGTGVRVGGGAFSGKDGTKVDRSAAYMARRVAIIALDKYPDLFDCTVQVAYGIGIAEPLVIEISGMADGGNYVVKLDEDVELPELRKMFEPKNMIEQLKLNTPIFEETARWGHFGNGFEWDKKPKPEV